MQPVVRFVGQMPGHADCGVTAFAMCLGIDYAEALVAVSRVKPTVLTHGVLWSELKRAAKKLGVTLATRTRGLDIEDDELEGILGVRFVSDGDRHAVYLKRGLVFDGRTNAVWDADVYLRIHNCDVESLLVRVL